MASPKDLPEGIFSLLDTDLYKLTMQCAILKYLPDTQLAHIKITLDELQYLRNTYTYFNDAYLRFLSSFRLHPSKDVKVSWTTIKDTDSADDVGDLRLDIDGLWLHTILYEIPLLALTSEAYFKFCDKDWNHSGQEQKAYEKGLRLLEHGCMFSEFGTRRRRDYHTHDLVMQGLMRATATAQQRGYTGKLTGTSNVHMAMRYGIPAIGTVAHEWFMGIASVTNDYVHANETALRYWVGCFGEGVLGIALTDTFGTPAFLEAFRKSMPTATEASTDTTATQLPNTPRPAVEFTNGVVDVSSSSTTNNNPSPPTNPPTEAPTPNPRTYASLFTGVRQDSGSPLTFINTMRTFYTSLSIPTPKTIVFSDSLNIDLCLTYKRAAEDAGFIPSFGIGTFFTNDFTRVGDAGEKSTPLNIVIKLATANGRPAVKISDNVGKNTGEEGAVRAVKETLGYVEVEWGDGDEGRRWGG
ncbi:nicotinate phosphoribosyltransferase [Lecanora helva]